MRAILIGLILTFVAPAAWAQTQDQYDQCFSATATDDQTIDGCTALIQSGRYAGVELSKDYNNRADGYIGKRQWSLAIADDNQAVQLDQTNAEAFSNRCFSYESMGLYDPAIADCSRAISLKANYAHAYDHRGYAYKMTGLREQAISDFRMALSVDSNDGFAADSLKSLGVTP